MTTESAMFVILLMVQQIAMSMAFWTHVNSKVVLQTATTTTSLMNANLMAMIATGMRSPTSVKPIVMETTSPMIVTSKMAQLTVMAMPSPIHAS